VVCAAFGFDDVALRAKQLAASSYKKPDVSLPRELTELTYDQYRDIRYKPERAYWRAAPDTHFIANWPSIHPPHCFTLHRWSCRPRALAT